jgi:hypothetical protein
VSPQPQIARVEAEDRIAQRRQPGRGQRQRVAARAEQGAPRRFIDHARARLGGDCAIGAHRAKRSKAITVSALDEVPGIGPSRKKALLMHFGTARAVRNASLEDLQKAPGVSAAVAQTIYDYYHSNG